MKWTPNEVGNLTLKQAQEICLRDPYRPKDECTRENPPTRDEIIKHRWKYYKRKPWERPSR